MPIIRSCAQPGCPKTVTDGPRCPAHSQQREQARGSRQQRGYDARHDQLRRRFEGRMKQGVQFTCWRCGKPIDPENWTLGHCDNDRNRYHGPECPPCDYATAGRHGVPCPHPKHTPKGVGGTPGQIGH